MSDAALARELAAGAGALLLELRARGNLSDKALGAEGDRIANDYLLAGLCAQRPDDAILSEEAKDDPARLTQRRVWIVDPLDGTREYGEGRDDWAVHVALAVDGAAYCGAVALPGLGFVYDSDSPVPLSPPCPTPRLVVSRSRPPAQAVALANAIGGTLISMGSAGAKAMAVLRGDADIYLHSGGQYEWDSCAPVAVALAHGLHASHIDGAALKYNRADTYLPDLLICRPEWADRALAFVADLQR